MCNLYSITTNQAAIIALFRVLNVGNLPPMPGVFPDYPAPVIRNAGPERELTMMRWGMPPPPRAGGYPVTNIRNTTSPHWRWLAEAGKPLPGPGKQLRRICAGAQPSDGQKGRRMVWAQ
jgi:putative SOS response-associated peptidase YedK